MRQPRRAPVALAYGAFVLVGVNAGVNGVLLAAQIDDYAVSRAALGRTFFAGSAGFMLASWPTVMLLLAVAAILLPFALALSLLQHVIWWPMARRVVRPVSPSPRPR